MRVGAEEFPENWEEKPKNGSQEKTSRRPGGKYKGLRMKIEGVGNFTLDDAMDWYESEEISIAIFDGKLCRFIIEDFDEEGNNDDYKNAMLNLLKSTKDVLYKAEKQIYQYYKATNDFFVKKPAGFPSIDKSSDIWKHIQFGDSLMMFRREKDNTVYISYECNCSWEVEHGLQIVFKNGLEINKVGPFDGHLTNSDS